MPLLSPRRTPTNVRGARRGLALGLEVGGAGFKLSLARYRRGEPEIIQQVRRRFVPAISFESDDIEALTSQLSDQLPRLCGLSDVPTIAVLPPQLSIYAVQHAASEKQAAGLAAAEVYEGQTDVCSLNAGNYSTYAIPGPFAALVADAIARGGYHCEAVVPHPLALRFAARMMGLEQAAVLDWGWQSGVLACGAGVHGYFCRNLHGVGLAQAYEQAARTAGVNQDAENWNAATSESQMTPRHRRLQDALHTTLTPLLHRLVQQVQQTIRYSQRYEVPPPKALILCGGGSLQSQVVDVLQRLLQMPVHRWRLAAGTPDQSAYAVSAAAALMPLHREAW